MHPATGLRPGAGTRQHTILTRSGRSRRRRALLLAGAAIATTLVAVPGGPALAEPANGERITVPRAGARNAGWSGTPAGLTWLSGASGDPTITGEFATWRNNQAQIGGIWSDTSIDEMLNMWSICPLGNSPALNFVDWNRPLDVAIMIINKNEGDSWGAAAKGAYLDRWSKNLDRVKECWGTRDPGMLYLRPSHEMNGDWADWPVAKGEEADYVKALALYSRLRYDRLPTAKIVFSPNDGTSEGLADPKDYWPGDHKDDPSTPDDDKYVGLPVANVYGLDSYNKWKHETTPVGVWGEKIIPYFERSRKLAESLGAPFAIPEWGNSAKDDDGGGGGESPVYMKEMYRWAAAHSGDPRNPRPGQLLYEIYFNQWKKYRLTEPTLQPETAAAYRALPWGTTEGRQPPRPGPHPKPSLQTQVLAQGECYGSAGWASHWGGTVNFLQFVPDAGARCDLAASTLAVVSGGKETSTSFAKATTCRQSAAGAAPCLVDRTAPASVKPTFRFVLCPAVGADKIPCRTFTVEGTA
ncbi:MAG: hypothetical protein QG622_2667 [Actinomycetota bacterium]|nr:hypothetical protein [Actinomycetota bacterium]